MEEKGKDAKDYRATIKDLVQRSRKDEAFRQQLRADPVAVLRQAGLPDEGIAEVLREDGYPESASGDVATRNKKIIDLARQADCWLSCPCTGCCFTRL